MPTISPARATPSRQQLAWATVATAAALLLLGAWSQRALGDRLLPHAFCISASQPLLLLHLASDGLIAFAYLAIPWAMLNIVRKRADIPFGWMAWVFGAFIVACGITHAMQMWTLWYPVYWYSGVAKAFTAAVSLGTAWLLYRMTPQALAMPSAQQLRETNAALEREVVARRQAEEKLAAAHRELQQRAQETSAVLDRFFEEAPLGMALIDAGGRLIRSNPGLAAETGRPASDYVGAQLAALPNLPPEVLEAVDDIGGGAAARRTFDAVRVREGVQEAWRCTMFRIAADGDGLLLGAVVQNITGQRRLEKERAAALDSLREADRRKDEFIAVLAHELRNPLAPIGTAAHALTRLAHADPAVARMAGIVRRQVSHMGRLLDDLLDVSRIVLGKLELRPEPCDLGAIARQVAEDHRDTFADGGTGLQVEVEPTLAIHGDPVRLAQAVGNYLQNAGKFAAGGHVRITAFVDSRHGEAVVRVEDDGPGIDPRFLEQLFQPFSQEQQDAARTNGGLGLGLALSRGIAQLHGGRVAAANNPAGRGCAFELRLPLVGAATAPHRSASA